MTYAQHGTKPGSNGAAANGHAAEIPTPARS
jgi:hypothetical protein